jgi:hypothetical protein
MRSFLLPSLLAWGLALPAFAQAPSEPASANPSPSANPPPDESWLDYPGPEAVAPPAESLPPPPILGSSRTEVVATAAPPKPARVSLHGAKVLQPGEVATGLMLGFPLASARVSVGVLPRLDVGAGVDTLYGIMNELRASARFGLVQGEEGHLALALEGGYAFFLNAPNQEEFGARYFTGRRNWNLMPGLVGSIKVGQASRGFLDARYHLAFDTQPFQRVPLGGVPRGVQLSSNFLFRVGVEVPFSERTSYVVMVGGSIHGRAEDASFMPVLGVGVVAGL